MTKVDHSNAIAEGGGSHRAQPGERVVDPDVKLLAPETKTRLAEFSGFALVVVAAVVVVAAMRYWESYTPPAKPLPEARKHLYEAEEALTLDGLQIALKPTQGCCGRETARPLAPVDFAGHHTLVVVAEAPDPESETAARLAWLLADLKAAMASVQVELWWIAMGRLPDSAPGRALEPVGCDGDRCYHRIVVPGSDQHPTVRRLTSGAGDPAVVLLDSKARPMMRLHPRGTADRSTVRQVIADVRHALVSAGRLVAADAIEQRSHAFLINWPDDGDSGERPAEVRTVDKGDEGI